MRQKNGNPSDFPLNIVSPNPVVSGKAHSEQDPSGVRNAMQRAADLPKLFLNMLLGSQITHLAVL